MAQASLTVMHGYLVQSFTIRPNMPSSTCSLVQRPVSWQEATRHSAEPIASCEVPFILSIRFRNSLLIRQIVFVFWR